MKPVAEAQFDGFIYPMVDHIVCHAARMRYRTRGRLTCPMVLRVPWGGGIRAPEHHSEANESIFTNVPGLRVVMPSSPARAYGLLLAAIRDPDPVIFFEPKRIYRQYKEVVPDDGEALPLDVCFVLRDGSDVTLVTWGAQVKETLEAADALAEGRHQRRSHRRRHAQAAGLRHDRRIGAQDRPLRDRARSAEDRRLRRRDRRAPGRGMRCTTCVAPVERVTGYDTHIPLFRLEMKYLPSVDKIVAAAKRAVGGIQLKRIPANMDEQARLRKRNSCCPTSAKACPTRPSSSGSSRSATPSRSTTTWSRWKPRRRSSTCPRRSPARC